MNGSVIKLTALLGLLLAMVAWPSAQDAPATTPIRGFSSSGAAAQRAVERRFKDH